MEELQLQLGSKGKGTARSGGPASGSEEGPKLRLHLISTAHGEKQTNKQNNTGRGNKPQPFANREKPRIREDRELSRRKAELAEAHGETTQQHPGVGGGHEPRHPGKPAALSHGAKAPTLGSRRDGSKRSCKTLGSLCPAFFVMGLRRGRGNSRCGRRPGGEAGGQEGDIFTPTLWGQQGPRSDAAQPGTNYEFLV